MTLSWPDADQVQRWLEQAGIDHYICDQCHGLHLSVMQEREAVLDCRIFVEEDWVLLSTELELRPSSLFAVHADIPRLSMLYPALKIFPDVNDEAMPRLVVCDVLHGRQGVSYDQFVHFVQVSLDATMQLATECDQLNYLFWPDEEAPGEESPGAALH